jgi:hypothetical protein
MDNKTSSQRREETDIYERAAQSCWIPAKETPLKAVFEAWTSKTHTHVCLFVLMLRASLITSNFKLRCGILFMK